MSWPQPTTKCRSAAPPDRSPGRYIRSTVERTPADWWRWTVQFTNAETGGTCQDYYAAVYAAEGIRDSWRKLARRCLGDYS